MLWPGNLHVQMLASNYEGPATTEVGLIALA